jgi:hypothetical protein
MLWLLFWMFLILGFSGLTRFLHIPNVLISALVVLGIPRSAVSSGLAILAPKTVEKYYA